MLITKEIKSVFKNKYVELQNNIVEDTISNQTFEHIKIIENGTKTPGSVILCKYNNKFLLIENYRYGIDETLIELPRGYVDENESLSECAIRELYEEVNITFKNEVDKIIKLGEIAVNSAIINSKVSLYLIEINHNISNIHLQSEECITSFKWHKLEDIFDDITNGKIIDSFTICTLFFYQLHQHKV